MKKTLGILFVMAALMAALAGCAKDEPAAQTLDPQVSEQQVDEISSASVKESADAEDVRNGLSENGYWIFALLDDVTINGELDVQGVFHNGDREDAAVYRKLALYAQDDDRNVTAEYTLTVSTINVASPNFRIQHGTVNGDIYVAAEGFELVGTTVEGNVHFATQELLDSANLEEATITGEITVDEPADEQSGEAAQELEETFSEEAADSEAESDEEENEQQ